MINELLSTELNGITVKLFEYDIDDEQSFSELRNYLISKIKSSKVHNVEKYTQNYYPTNLNPKFVEKLNKRISEIAIPIKSKIPQFDVRRERVTEWMAQFLLEREYNCKFFDEADKRMNIEIIDVDKHTSGIDVPGIRIINNQIKFVVCEVKASDSKNIPYKVISSLQDDIQKSIDNNNERVTKEILQYIHNIRDIKITDNDLNMILLFLCNLIEDSHENLKNNIMFFPLIIRSNTEIIKNNDVSDYNNFNVHNISSENIENILFAFQKSINQFSDEIYEEAIENE